MNRFVDRKKIKWLLISLVAFAILFPDVAYDLISQLLGFLFDLILSLAHLLFEAIESVLDSVIEEMLNTDMHATQAIGFYVLLAGGIFIMYKLLRAILGYCKECKQNMDRYYGRIIEFWFSMTTMDKVKYGAIALAVVYYYVSFMI